MSRRSMVAVSTLVSALNVLSTTLPDMTLFSLVRTKAGPLPGLTCWNSMPRQTELLGASAGPLLIRERGTQTSIRLDMVCGAKPLRALPEPRDSVAGQGFPQAGKCSRQLRRHRAGRVCEPSAR